jgi:uncharacterized damage-inducible protein DinB
MDRDAALRTHVLNLLTARQAHCTFEEAVDGMPPDRVGERPDGLPYSVWELVDHVRRAQYDILAYCEDPDYQAQEWPDAYWPNTPAPPSTEVWQQTCEQVVEDRDVLCQYLEDDAQDLYETVPSSDDHTILRELLLVADHNAYHIGQIVTVRRLLGCWVGDETET